MKGILTLAAAAIFAYALPAMAGKNVNPNQAPPGAWVRMGTVSADHGADHDTITVHGNDNFRRLRFKVTDAPLHLQRMVVTYENGQPDNIPVSQNIPKGGQSRVFELQGSGTRSIRRVDFWYSTKGQNNGKADVQLWGQR